MMCQDDEGCAGAADRYRPAAPPAGSDGVPGPVGSAGSEAQGLVWSRYFNLMFSSCGPGAVVEAAAGFTVTIAE